MYQPCAAMLGLLHATEYMLQGQAYIARTERIFPCGIVSGRLTLLRYNLCAMGSLYGLVHTAITASFWRESVVCVPSIKPTSPKLDVM